MSENVATFAITLTATGEVRDKDGALLSSTPVTGEFLLTAAELEALIERQIRP